MAKHLLAPPQGRCIPLQSQDALCRVLPPPLFTFIYHYLTQVEALLLKINSRKSCGYDGIPPRLVKESANAIACLLYTSDAADEEDSVDLGGRRIIKKKMLNSVSETK